MIAFPFAAGSVCVVLAWILFRVCVYKKTKSLSWKREAVQLLFLVNLLVIHRMTFHPFEKLNGEVQPLLYDPANVWPFRMNLVPFVNLLDYDSKRDMLLNIIGNSAMFIPTGVMTPLIYKHLDSFKKTVLTGFLISFAIEILQLPFSVRCSDVDDLILNTLGVIIGYFMLFLIRFCKKKSHR